MSRRCKNAGGTERERRSVEGRRHGSTDDSGIRYVYLQPVYTKDSAQASTFFDLVVQDSSNAAYLELVKGAGAAYRSLVPVYNKRENRKIVGATLFRTMDLRRR